MSKTDTINIGNGVKYAKVSTRLTEFLNTNKNSSIDTCYEFKGDYVIFKAKITPDHTLQSRYYTGTSLGKAAGLKAFEKLETIAVGRALAFCGYLSNGEIASEEEMQQYGESATKIDVTQTIEKLKTAKNMTELAKLWRALSEAERNDSDVLEIKDKLKKTYEEIPSGAKNPGVVESSQG